MLTTTPTVARVTDSPRTGLSVLHRAVSPPSAMITMSAQNPSVRVRSASSNWMPSPDSPMATPSAR